MFKRLRLKRINHLYKKACKALAKFDNAIGKDTAYQFLKQIIYTVYGKQYMNAFYGKIITPIYQDTDSIKNIYNYTNCHEEYDGTDSVIYADFNKKSEV